MARERSARDRLIVEAVEHFDGHGWVEADQVRRRLDRDGKVEISTQGLGRVLGRLADEELVERKWSGYMWLYRPVA